MELNQIHRGPIPALCIVDSSKTPLALGTRLDATIYAVPENVCSSFTLRDIEEMSCQSSHSIDILLTFGQAANLIKARA